MVTRLRRLATPRAVVIPKRPTTPHRVRIGDVGFHGQTERTRDGSLSDLRTPGIQVGEPGQIIRVGSPSVNDLLG